MRHSALCFCVAAAALAGQHEPAQAEQPASPGQAGQALPSAAPPRPVTVNLRLSPDLGDSLPQVRAALLGVGPVRVAEPADYEITTKRDFPQSLIALDAQQPESDWRSDFSADPPRPVPRTVELGNLVLGDFADRLKELIVRRERASQLLAAGLAAAPAEVETCLVAYMDPSLPEICRPGPRRSGSDSSEPPEVLDGEMRLTASLRNRSGRPIYATLLWVDPSTGIIRAPFRSGAEITPLAPGARRDSVLLPSFGYSSGYVILVTITSVRPIDTSSIEQVPFSDLEWDDCLQLAAGCDRPALAIPPDWSISLAEFYYRAPILAGIGGGLEVLEGMAPWMAEIYSTVPYTQEEIAADALKPPDQREYLAERRPAERSHRCGGSLIAPNVVLTAAHCVAKGKFAGDGMVHVMKDRRVRVGTARLGRGGTTLAIAGVAVPASYSPNRQNDDIALLLLKPDRSTKSREDAVIGPGDKPIADGTDVTAFGWGYTGVVAPDANPLFNVAEQLQRNPDMLRFGRMRALSWGACKKRLKARLGPGMVCVVAPGAETGAKPERNVFSCRGDSGGPLVRKTGETEELVGLTSWSLGCGYKDIPSVYTDVTKYRRWIAAAMQQLRPGAALRVDEKAAPSRREERRQSAQ